MNDSEIIDINNGETLSAMIEEHIITTEKLIEQYKRVTGRSYINKKTDFLRIPKNYRRGWMPGLRC